jgi:acyl-CoA synthetase (AMP-forming)/AMP-acid ligase II
MTMYSFENILQGGDPDAVIAFDGHHSYRRAAWLQDIAALTAVLQSRKETRWLLVHDNSYRFSIGLFALLAAGKQVVLPPNVQSGTLASLGDLPVLSPDPIAIDETARCEHLNLLPLDLERLTITVLTSGSTGEAKAICKPLRCFAEELRVLEQQWGAQLGKAAVLATVSHQHIYGLLFRLLWPLCAGRPFAAETALYPETLVASIRQWPRSVLVSSPAQLQRFPPALDVAAMASQVAAIFSSGGPLPFAVAQQWRAQLGQWPLEVFGSSESGGVAWREQQVANEPWQPLPTVQLQLQGGDLLAVRSPFTGETDWLLLADRAELLPDGRFHLLGRADTIIKVSEKRLSLTAMERVLSELPVVAMARIVPLQGDSGRLGAAVILTVEGAAFLASEGKRSLVDRLRAHLLAHFERVLLPRKWRFLAELPQNAQGKTTMADLQQLFCDETVERKSDQPQVIVSNEQQRVVQWHFASGSQRFAGHFPDLPILPGVVQFDLAVRQCADWYPLSSFRRIDKLKFQEPIVPGDTVTLSLEHNGNGQVTFSYRLGQQPLSSGRILFGDG